MGIGHSSRELIGSCHRPLSVTAEQPPNRPVIAGRFARLYSSDCARRRTDGIVEARRKWGERTWLHLPSTENARTWRYSDYQVARMSDVPHIEIKVVSTDNHPTGGGEEGVPLVACAVGNAIAKLTSVRLRELPFSPERVRGALGA